MRTQLGPPIHLPARFAPAQNILNRPELRTVVRQLPRPQDEMVRPCVRRAGSDRDARLANCFGKLLDEDGGCSAACEPCIGCATRGPTANGRSLAVREEGLDFVKVTREELSSGRKPAFTNEGRAATGLIISTPTCRLKLAFFRSDLGPSYEGGC